MAATRFGAEPTYAELLHVGVPSGIVHGLDQLPPPTNYVEVVPIKCAAPRA